MDNKEKRKTKRSPSSKKTGKFPRLFERASLGKIDAFHSREEYEGEEYLDRFVSHMGNDDQRSLRFSLPEDALQNIFG